MAVERHYEAAAERPLADLHQCPDRQQAATRLGRERRWLFVVGAMLSVAAPALPYLTGAWESVWYWLAASWLPLWTRTVLFLGLVYALLALVALPLAYYSGFVLAHRFGLSRQNARAWWMDWLRAAALSGLLNMLVGGIFFWTATAFPGLWWAAFGAVLTLGVLLLTFLVPYVLVPLFFKMRPLQDEATVTRIVGLFNRAGVPAPRVCTLDFSRRTVEANAAVIGMGRSRRVILADTMLATFPPSEIDTVVAHELAHHVHRDVPRLLLANLAVIWVGLWLASWLERGALPVLSLPGLWYVPGYPMLMAVAAAFQYAVLPLVNWFSRRREAAADLFALRLTRDPSSFAAAMVRLSCQNLVEVQPPRWVEALLASHPPIYRRVAMARAWGP